MRRRHAAAASASAAAALLAVLAAPRAAASGTTVSSVPEFTGGALPPYSATLSRNEDAEPGIAVDGAGNFWIGSDIAPFAADDPRAVEALSGEDIWTSTDGGQTYSYVSDPFTVNGGNAPGLAGEDSDIAVAPAKNANGFYNVYAVSLWIGSSSVAVSQDGGKTWIVDELGGIPAEDRPWVGAGGPCTFYVAYHQLPTFSPVVNKYDICTPSISMGEVLNPVQSTSVFLANTAPGLSNAFGKVWVDNSPTSAHEGNIYVPMEGCNLQSPQDFISQAEASSGCATGTKSQIIMGVSTDGDVTWNDYPVTFSTNGEETVWPDNVTTDADGNVYVVWTDNHDSYIDVSTDGGQTWTAPQQLNVAPSLDAIYPTVAAAGHGQVDVAWYGGSVAGDSNDQTAMGLPNAPGAAQWNVYVAKSSDGGVTFTQTQATGVVHTGVLCTQGSNCSLANARNLLDDFDVAISPTTGLASIAYTDDQPQGQQGTIFTGFATEQPSPSSGTPEAPVPGLLIVAGAGAAAWARLALRRTRGRRSPATS
jgi:hypothetical protein